MPGSPPCSRAEGRGRGRGARGQISSEERVAGGMSVLRAESESDTRALPRLLLVATFDMLHPCRGGCQRCRVYARYIGSDRGEDAFPLTLPWSCDSQTPRAGANDATGRRPPPPGARHRQSSTYSPRSCSTRSCQHSTPSLHASPSRDCEFAIALMRAGSGPTASPHGHGPPTIRSSTSTDAGHGSF